MYGRYLVKKLILMGRSESGKTTLTQALMDRRVEYHKTQYVNYYDGIIDTPGEYTQNARLGHALAVYTYEADVVGLLCAATEPYCLFPPNITCQCNRDVIGIVTKIDDPRGNPKRAERWLRLCGCKKIFFVNSTAKEGTADILEYLCQPGEIPPWKSKTTKSKTEATKKP